MQVKIVLKKEIKNVVNSFINAVTEYFEAAVQDTVRKYNQLDSNHTWKIGKNACILIDNNVRIKVLEHMLDGDLEEDLFPVEFTVGIDKNTEVKFTDELFGNKPEQTVYTINYILEILANSKSPIHKIIKGTRNFSITSFSTKQLHDSYNDGRDAEFEYYIEEDMEYYSLGKYEYKKYCGNIKYWIGLSTRKLDRDGRRLDEDCYDEYIITDRYIVKIHQGDKETFIEEFYN